MACVRKTGLLLRSATVWLMEHTNNGFIASTAVNPAFINLDNCTSSNNGNYGLVATGTGTIVYTSNSTITNNGVMGIRQVNGGSVASFGNNRNFGNTTNGAPDAHFELSSDDSDHPFHSGLPATHD